MKIPVKTPAGTTDSIRLFERKKNQGVARSSRRVATKTTSKVAGKALTKTSIKVGAKLAAAGTRSAVAASAGPAGWVAGALMLAFEVIMIALDVIDVGGYQSYTSQAVLQKMKDQADLAGFIASKNLGDDYPYLFPLSGSMGFVPEEFEIASQYMQAMMTLNYADAGFSLDTLKSTLRIAEEEVKNAQDALDTLTGSDPILLSSIDDEITRLAGDSEYEAPSDGNDGLINDLYWADESWESDGEDWTLLPSVAKSIDELNAELDGLYEKQLANDTLAIANEYLSEAQNAVNAFIEEYPNAPILPQNVKLENDTYFENYIEYYNSYAAIETELGVTWFEENGYNEFGDTKGTVYDETKVYTENPGGANPLGTMYVLETDEFYTFLEFAAIKHGSVGIDADGFEVVSFPWSDGVEQALLDANISEPEFPDLVVEYTIAIPKLFHRERDAYLFEMLQQILNNSTDLIKRKKAKEIILVPSMSSPRRIGISITEDAAKNWNELHKQGWIDNNDMFAEYDPSKIDVLYDQPLMASFTDTYSTINLEDPGTQKDPKMMDVKIVDADGNAIKVVLGTPYGPSLSYCVRKRQLSEYSTGIDPKEFGVTFDYNLGKCMFTKAFCTKYGLQFSGNDCKMLPGQNTAQLIFGETLSRTAITGFQEKVINNLNSDNPLKIALGGMFIVNPGLLAAVVVGEAIFNEISMTTHKKSRPADLRSCKSYSPNMVSSGTDCWLNTIPKRSSLQPLKSCGDESYVKKHGKKLTDDGTSCWRHTVAKKHNAAKLLSCKGRSKEKYPNGDYVIDKNGNPNPDAPRDKKWTGLSDDQMGSCWRHIKLKKLKFFPKQSCEGPVMRDNTTGEIVKNDDGTDRRKWTYENGEKLVDDKISCWSHAKWRGVGKFPKCSNEQNNDDDILNGYPAGNKYENNAGICYRRCKKGYRGVGPVCWEDGCKAGDENDTKTLRRGLVCYEDCNRKDATAKSVQEGGWFNQSLLQCAKCPSGYKRDMGGKGVACEKGSIEGLNYAWRPVSAVTSRETRPINTYSRAAKGIPDKCTGTYSDKNAGLCYKPCKDEEGSKYEGVGPTCWPTGKGPGGGTRGAGIKKTLFDRTVCPARTIQSDTCNYINAAHNPQFTFRNKNDVDVNQVMAVEELKKILINEGKSVSVIEKLANDGGINSDTFKKQIEYLLECPDRSESVAGVCVDDCNPETHYNRTAYCEPKDGVGIIRNAWDRHYCGPSTFQSKKCSAITNNWKKEQGGAGENRNLVIKELELVNDTEFSKVLANSRNDTRKTWTKAELINDVRQRGVDDTNIHLIEPLLKCPERRKADFAGTCWDTCPPIDYASSDDALEKYKSTGTKGEGFVEYADIGWLCHPTQNKNDNSSNLKGPGIKVDTFTRQTSCGPSIYQPQRCIDIGTNIGETIGRLKDKGETDLVGDLEINGFTTDNTKLIENALDCPKKRALFLGRCYDQCPRKNLNPQNKKDLIEIKNQRDAPVVGTRAIFDLRQKQFDDWKTVMQHYGETTGDFPTPEHARYLIPKYMAMPTMDEARAEYRKRDDILNIARTQYESDTLEYNKQLDTFRRKLSFGYEDLGAICEPMGASQIGESDQDKKDARESANLAQLSSKQRGAGAGIKVPLMSRYYCDDDETNIAGTCWSKCPAGYRDDGATCNKN